jgi:hypothetical protein
VGAAGLAGDRSAGLRGQAGREYRDDMARRLALEVLMTDEVAGQDDVLQERVKEGLRAKTRHRKPECA